MVRVLAVLVMGLMLSPICAAEPIKFAAPLNVAAEKAKIINEFIDAQKKKLPYAEALAARDAALSQLAAAAEKANSTEFGILSVIYDALGRPEDTVRTARAAVEQSPQAVGPRALLFKSLCDLERVDEAGAQYAKIVAADISVADQQAYLQRFPTATEAYVHLLIADKRLDEAKQAVAAYAAQLHKLDVAWEKSPGFRKGFGGTTFMARQSIGSMKVELENLRIKNLVERASAPDTGPVKPSPAPTAAPPLYVGYEIDDIVAKFDLAQLPAAARTGPEAAKLLAQRDEALRALAARKEIATNRDFAGLIQLATLLKRTDDGLAYYTRWLNDDPTGAAVDEAWASPFNPNRNKVTPFLLMLCEAGKFNEAFQALAALNAKLDQLGALIKQGVGPPKLPVYRVTEGKFQVADEAFSKLLDAEGAAYAKATAPMPIRYARPLNVKQERARINRRRYYLAKVDQARAEAEAKTQLGLLAAAAEQEPSPDYVEIVDLYETTTRGDDAFRVARGAVKLHPDPLAPRVALLEALSFHGPKEELVAEFLKLPSIDFSKISEYDAKQFLLHAGDAGDGAFRELQEQKKFEEAKKLVDDWDARLDVVEARFPSLQGWKTREGVPQGFVLQMRGSVAWLRDKLPGEFGVPRGGVPPVEPPSVTVDHPLPGESARDFIERMRGESIMGKAMTARSKWLHSFGRSPKPEVIASPGYQKALANLRQELSPVVARGLAANPVDHYSLFRAYVYLQQPADFVREMHAMREQDPNNFLIFYQLIDAQCELNRYDDAIATVREWLALDVPLAQSEAYIEPFDRTRSFRNIYEGLVEADRVDDARRLSGEVKEKFEKMLARYDASPVAGVKRPTFTNALIFVRSADDDIGRLLKAAQAVPESALSAEITQLSRSHIITRNTIGRDTDRVFQAKVKARRDAFAELAARAEAQKSSDHAALMYVYGAADLREKALAEVKLVLAADPGKYVAYSAIMTALAELSDPGPALDFLNEWIGAPATPENYLDFIAPLRDPFTGVPVLIDRLGDAGRDAEGRAALARLKVRIDELERQFAATTVKPARLREADFFNAQISVTGCNSTLDHWLEFHFNNSSGRLAFAQPLHLDREMMRLSGRRFERALRTAKGPEFDRAQADYLEGLSQLAAAAELARSTDRMRLIEIYAELKRSDDVLRLGRLVMAEKPGEFGVAATLSKALRQAGKTADADAMLAAADKVMRPSDRMQLITIYADLKRADDVLRQGRLAVAENPGDFTTMAALSLKLRQVGKTADADAMRDRALAIDVTPAMAARFTASSFFYVNTWFTALLDEKRFADAAAIVQRWEQQLASLEAKLKRSPVVEEGQTVSTVAALQHVADLKKALEEARRR